MAAHCCHLANATELLTPVLWTMAGGWVRTLVLFLATCGPKYAKLSLPVRECPSLQRHFLTDDVSLLSRDIHDHVAKLSEITLIFHVFGLPNFRGGGRGHPVCYKNQRYNIKKWTDWPAALGPTCLSVYTTSKQHHDALTVPYLWSSTKTLLWRMPRVAQLVMSSCCRTRPSW